MGRCETGENNAECSTSKLCSRKYGRSQHIPRVLALADIWSIHRGLIAVSFGAKKQPKNCDKTLLKWITVWGIHTETHLSLMLASAIIEIIIQEQNHLVYNKCWRKDRITENKASVFLHGANQSFISAAASDRNSLQITPLATADLF